MVAAAAPPRPRLPWADRWRDACDGWVADAGFRRAVARLPVLRWVARYRARRLFDLAAGFVYSQVLSALVALDLPQRLRRDGPQPVDRLASDCGWTPEAMQRLADAAVALDLLRWRSGGRVGLGPLGAPLVDNAAVSAMVAHHRALYQDLADPAAVFAGGSAAMASFWPYAGTADRTLSDAEVAPYSHLMSSSVDLVADEVLHSGALKGCRRVLDVGGGEGGFARLLARHDPAVQVTVMDLPAVATQAWRRFCTEGLQDRCNAVGGDFLRDALPSGVDAVTVLRVLHDHDDEAVKKLLRSARAALREGGRLVVAEPLAPEQGTKGVACYFTVYLAAMGQGRPRTAAELTRLLQDAGFRRVACPSPAVPLQASVLVAHV
jgi:demethylspheroidene O-methyltransferase